MELRKFWRAPAPAPAPGEYSGSDSYSGSEQNSPASQLRSESRKHGLLWLQGNARPVSDSDSEQKVVANLGGTSSAGAGRGRIQLIVREWIQDFSQGWEPSDGLVLECYWIVHFEWWNIPLDRRLLVAIRLCRMWCAAVSLHSATASTATQPANWKTTPPVALLAGSMRPWRHRHVELWCAGSTLGDYREGTGAAATVGAGLLRSGCIHPGP